MKKVLSALLVCIMIVTMSTTMAFAADCNFVLTLDKTAVQPNDVITLAIKLDSNPGIAGYKIAVGFDSTAFERTTITYVNSDDEEVTEDVKTSWGSPTINDDAAGKTVMSWSATGNKTSKTVLTMCYKVKSTAVNGTNYNFTVSCDDAANADKAVVTIGSASTEAITISGGVEPGEGDDNNDSIITDADGDGVYDIADTAATTALKGKKVVFGTITDGTITETTRLQVTNNNLTTDKVRTFGSNLADKLGIQIDGGEFQASKVKFGIVFDAEYTTWTAANFEFKLINIAE